jgi:hypothetical protein
MRRDTQTTLVLVGISTVALIAFWTYRRTYADQNPTRDEFQIYSALLARLASDRGLRPTEMVLARTTLQLSAPVVVSWIPAELRQQKMRAPSEFVSFCGALCGHDFERKNATTWQLTPDTRAGLDAPVVEPIPAGQQPERRVIEVSRVGFDLWHRRAVLMYSANCTELSPEFPRMCVELGQVYLRKKDGAWRVDHYQSFTF